MYPFERYIMSLKGYVRNRARPEGCIVKCYLADECMNSFSLRTKQVADTDNLQPEIENCQNQVSLEGNPISKGVNITLSDEMLQNAHRCVLFNAIVIEPYLRIHLDELRRSNRHLLRNDSLLWKKHSEEFSSWLKLKIEVENIYDISRTLKWLANGPRRIALSYPGYDINGQRYHRKSAEKSTQNSGVSIQATTVYSTNARDTDQTIDIISHYGVIKDIVLLDYYTFRIPLFDCDWVNISNGVKVDDGFTLVNLHHKQHQFERDPFILASQAKKVFYSRDNDTSPWYVVLKAPPRSFHESNENLETMDPFDTYSRPIDVSRLDKNIDAEDCSYVRENCDGIYV